MTLQLGEQPAAAHLMSAPTQSTPLTGEGMILGTLQYKAPERLEGKPPTCHRRIHRQSKCGTYQRA